MIGLLRLSVRFPLVILCILITLIAMNIGSLLGARKLNRSLMCASFTVGSFLFGLRITQKGELSKQRPLLLVSNHFSYLDIFAIGSLLPVAFTPKSDIAGWPVVGRLCTMAGCLFIDRRQSKTLESTQLLENAKKEGEIISLFPEGTTNDGTGILPFKSSFFSLAEHSDLAVQPLSVVYTHLNGKSLDPSTMSLVGWYGDSYLLPHVITLLQQKNVDVVLAFHEAISGNQFSSRKELAQYCKQQIEKSLR